MTPLRALAVRWVGATALALTALGCSASAPPPNDVDIATTGGGHPSNGTAGGSTTTPRTATGEAPAFHLPGQGRPLIGSPCSGEAFCGTRARIAVEEDRYGVMRPRDPSWQAPCTLVSLSREDVAGDVRAACVAGGHLFARSECRMCRIPMIREVVAKVDEMTPEQAGEIARMLGVRAPVPATADDWARAIETTARR